MKQLLLLSVAFFVVLNAGFTQMPTPGGVRQTAFWLVTDPVALQPSFTNLSGTSPAIIPQQNTSGNVATLNGYPALKFNGASRVPLDLGSFDLAGASYFTVYKPENLSAENILWYTSRNQKTELVLTPKRVADLGIYKYMNYTDVVPLNPKVHSYVQLKEKDSTPTFSQTLSIGAKPSFPELPVSDFKGLLPEIIIYDRPLDWEEQLRVTSYLALKYGITLTEPGGLYLNSSGEQIWNGSSYSQFHNNIAGIARDDSSGLLQKSASSSNNVEFFKVSTNVALADHNFLMWGDNNLPLFEAEKIPGVPTLLERKWLVVGSGFPGSISTTIAIDTKQMDVATPARPVYWLAIDRSGTGDFGQATTEYIRMTSLDKSGKAHFENVVLHKNGNKNEVLAIAIGKDILAGITISSPRCTDRSSGKFDIRMFGGNAPYRVSVFKDGNVFSETISSTGIIAFSTISAGRYKVKITDAERHEYTDEFYVNNEDGPKPLDLAPVYVLQAGVHITLNPGNTIAGLQYEWNGPANFHSFSKEITISKDGTYSITVSNGNCRFVQDTRVVRPPKNTFKNITIYPNPSNGVFTVKISLDNVAPVTMDIFTGDGRAVTRRELSGFANYTITEELFTSGSYYLVFQAGLSTTTEKLIIVK